MIDKISKHKLLIRNRFDIRRWKASFGLPCTPVIVQHPGPIVAIRREDASVWERRAPLAPSHVRKLVRQGVKVIVQPSNRRAYPIQSYVQSGAIVQEDISEAPVIIGVKQVPVDSLLPNKTYAFFSHTIKAQEANMPLLDAILDRNIRLIDYEKLVDADGQRVVAFGRYAGIAGMIDIMHGLGLRLLALGHHTPFMHIGPAHNYRTSGMAKQAIRDAGYEIALSMMPRSIGPLTIVFTGSGHVSKGAQEVFEELPYEYVDVKDLAKVCHLGQPNKIYGTVVSRSDHLVHKEGNSFDAEESIKYPERYYSNFATDIAPYASVIVNGIYWAPNSPKLLTIPDAKRLLQPTFTPWLPTSVGSPALPHRLLAICDISADPGGSIEFMTECTTIDNPFCLYDADYNKHSGDFAGPGVLVCSIDNMPTQLPLEATEMFGDLLTPYLKDIIKSDATKSFESNQFGAVVSGACITSNGKLTPNFQYIFDWRTKKASTRASSKSPHGKHVLVLGAGYVAAPLVELLTRDETVFVTVASELKGPGDALVTKALHANAESIVIDVTKNNEVLDKLIEESAVVVSLLPYTLHPLIAEKCIKFKTNMVTASYATPNMLQLHDAAVEAGVTILNEVGLDPGIDHLLAMECFDQVESNGGKITSFVSYCGGLPAPENAENPLRYKFSWNPKGVLLNSVAGAKWIENNEVKVLEPYGALMENPVELPFMYGYNLEGYPNRDSTVYRNVYKISSAKTIIRGTLRYKGFCNSMRGLQIMNLLDHKPHPSLHQKGPEITWKEFMCTLLGHRNDLLRSNLKNLIQEKVMSESRTVAIEELGLLDDEPIAKQNTPIDTLTYYLLNKLAYNSSERDLIILKHQIGIEWPDSTHEVRDIKLVVYGEPNGYSAMAKTVGYPTAIAANMILNGEIQIKGMLKPLTTEIYHPILKRLHDEGISSVEKSTKL